MFFISSTQASGPSSNRLLNYQIRLSDPTGIPVADGTKNIKISFYAASTGGTPIATDCGTTGTPVGRKVVFTNGVGSVLIGETTADASHNCTDSSAPNAIPSTLFDNTALFLGITVESDAEMTPRKRVVATGYSLNADKLDDLESSAIGGSTAFVPVTDSSGNFTLTKNVTVDTDTFFVDSANDGVGIGTASPMFKVHVNGGTTVAGVGATNIVLDVHGSTDAAIRIRSNGDIGTFADFRAVNGVGLHIEVDDSEKLTILTSGNIGIGELNPIFKLDINGTSGIRVTGPSMYGLMLKSTDVTSDFMGIRWRDNANANLWSMGNDFNGTGNHDFWLFDNVNGETLLLADQAATSYLSFGTTNGGLEYDNVTQQARLFTNGTNKVFVNGTGNVGIGDADPANFKLEVAGHVGPGTDDTHDLGSNTFRWRDLYLGPATLHIGTSTTDEGTISYDTTTNALQIDTVAGGVVEIAGGSGSSGCSVDASGNFSCAGTVAGGGGAAGAFVNGGNSFAGAATLGTNDNFNLAFETNGTTKMTLENDGDLAVDTNTLFVDAANNRVGIATATPSFALDVTGDIRSTGTLRSNGSAVFGSNILQTSDTSTYFGMQPVSVNNVGRQLFMDTGIDAANSHRITMGLQTAGGQLSNAFTTGAILWSGTLNASSTAYDLYIGAHQHDGVTGADPAKMMTFKASNFRVGIHTSSPASTFDVSGNMSLGSYAGVNAAPANGLIVSGNVGIGTNNPLHKLHLVGQGIRVEVGGGDFPRYSLNKSDAGVDQKKWQNYAAAAGLNFSAVNDAESAENFWLQVVRGAGTAITSVNFPSGNVGVGDSSPAATLTVGDGDLFQVAGASGNITTSGDIAVNGGDITTSSPTFNLAASATTLNLAGGSGSTGCTVDSSGNLTCSGTVGSTGGAAFINGGNSFAGAATLGTNDNFNLAFETNGTTKMTLENDGDLAVDTDSLFVDATNNRVGIGTASPSTTLEVKDENSVKVILSATGLHQAFINFQGVAGNTDYKVGKSGADDFAILQGAGNTDVFHIDSGGRIGIGTSTPATTDANALALKVDIRGGGLSLPNNSSFSFRNSSNTASYPVLRVNGSDVLDFGDLNNVYGPINFYAQGSHRMRLASSGLGINLGLVDATYRFEVADSGSGTKDVMRLRNTVAAANDSASQILFAARNDLSTITNVAGVAGAITDVSNGAYKGALVFSTSNNAAPAERMRIDNVGTVLPGTDNTQDLGSTSLRWKTLHVGPGSVVVHNDTVDTNKLVLNFGGSVPKISAISSASLELSSSNGSVTLASSNNFVIPSGNLSIGGGVAISSARALMNITGYAQSSGTFDFASAVTTSLNNTSWNIDSNTLVVDALNNRVGIGTASPGQLLELVGGENSSIDLKTGALTLRSSVNTVSGAQFGTVSSHKLTLFTGNTDRLNILADGNIGIGTASPVTQLHVSGKVPTAATGSVATSTQPDGLYIQGNYAYVTNSAGTQALQIFDVSNPTSPVAVGSISASSIPRGVYVQGKYAYVVTQNSNTLKIFDVSNPASPSAVSTTSLAGTAGDRVYVQGKYAYVTSGGTLQIFDVTNPSAPVSVGTYTNGTFLGGVHVQGRYAYILNTTGSLLEVIDVSNPASPSSAGSVAIDASAYGLHVQGRYAYVTSQNLDRLAIFDISNPASPSSVGTLTVGSDPYQVYVQGRYAYIVNSGSATLQVVDVSTPSAPTSVGTVAAGTTAIRVMVQGRYAYVVNFNSNNLQIFEVGGSYIQQLEAGGIETGTLSVRNNLQALDADLRGGLSVGQHLNVSGRLGVQGSSTFIGNVGIGTAAPSVALDVSGSANVSGLFNGQKINFTIGETYGITTAQNWKIATLPQSTNDIYDHVIIDTLSGGWLASQKYAIHAVLANRDAFTYSWTQQGTAPAGAESGCGSLRAYDNGAGGVDIYLFYPGNTTWCGGASVSVTFPRQVTVNPTPTDVGASPAGSLVFDTNSATYPPTITGLMNGNVGIGTTTPNKKLDVNGAVELNLPGTGTSFALCHTTQTGTTNEEIVDCTGAPAADYAENYPTAADVIAGDIVSLGEVTSTTKDGETIRKLVKATVPYGRGLIGVVSDPAKATDFNVIGYNIKEEDHPMPIALNGRVKVTVSTENGAIQPGDPITASSTPGIAMKATMQGMIVGFALDSYEGVDNGSLMVFVNPGWWNGSELQDSTSTSGVTRLAELTVDADKDLMGFGLLNVGFIRGAGDLWSIDSNGKLTVKETVADKVSIRTTDQTKTIAEATIFAGSAAAVVENAQIKSNSQIFVTFKKNPKSLWWIDETHDGVFILMTEQPVAEDTKFAYWIINVIDESTPPVPPPEPESVTEALPTDELVETDLEDTGEQTVDNPVDEEESAMPEEPAEPTAEEISPETTMENP